jgi:hypothetical protein
VERLRLKGGTPRLRVTLKWVTLKRARLRVTLKKRVTLKRVTLRLRVTLKRVTLRLTLLLPLLHFLVRFSSSLCFSVVLFRS